MTTAEIIEDIRSRLNEFQVNTVDRPWAYRTEEFTPHMRSAIRQLRALGVVVAPTMDESGVLSDELTDTIGVLVSIIATIRLVRGDLLTKLRDGELGVIFRTGADLIDTKTAATRMENAATELDRDIDTLLAVAMASAEQTTAGDGAFHYGGQEPYPG
jgi:hypothetical protein